MMHQMCKIRTSTRTRMWSIKFCLPLLHQVLQHHCQGLHCGYRDSCWGGHLPDHECSEFRLLRERYIPEQDLSKGWTDLVHTSWKKIVILNFLIPTGTRRPASSLMLKHVPWCPNFWNVTHIRPESCENLLLWCCILSADTAHQPSDSIESRWDDEINTLLTS